MSEWIEFSPPRERRPTRSHVNVLHSPLKRLNFQLLNNNEKNITNKERDAENKRTPIAAAGNTAVDVTTAANEAASVTTAPTPEHQALTKTIEELRLEITVLEKENTQLILSSKKREEELNDDTVYALLGRVAVLSGKLHESDLVTSLKKLPKDALAKLSVLKIKDIRDVQSRAKETKEIQKATRNLQEMVGRVSKTHHPVPNQQEKTSTYAQALAGNNSPWQVVSKNQQPTSRPSTKSRFSATVSLKSNTTLVETDDQLKHRMQQCLPAKSKICILNANKSKDGKSVSVNIYPLERKTEFEANADTWFTPLSLTTSIKQHLAVIHGFKIRQDDPFAQVTRDLNDQGFETAFGDIRWLSQRKVSSAEKKYSSIVLKIANESKHRQLLESSEIFLDGQWHNIAAFNYHRPPKECADATMAGSKAITA